MSEITTNKPVQIREDYLDAAERCALSLEKILKNEHVDLPVLYSQVQRWRDLRKIIS